MMSLPSLPFCVQLGDTIAERYRLECVLGAGRAGIVVAAMHLPSADRVAIHFMSPRGSPPTIGACTRAIERGVLEDGTLYAVIANLEQADLRRLLSSETLLPPGDVEHGRERARQRLQRMRSSTRARSPDSVRSRVRRAA